MIEKKELRLGNLLMDIVSGEWMVVDEIGENVGAYLINIDRFPLSEGWQMTPIPLTPEILEMAGFTVAPIQYTNGLNYYQLGDFTYNEAHEAWWYNSKILANQPGSLHQLQNLFFALTATELEINLNKEA